MLSETVSHDGESGKTTSYEYDAEGRLTKTTYPSSTGLGTVNYEYDQYGRLENIKKGTALLRTYTYDAFNQVTTIKDYDKPGSSSYVLKSYTYDIFGRTISAVYTEDGNASKVLESYAYTYDKNDNILSETRISNLPAEDSIINETRTYVYDAYGRLSQSTITDHTEGDVQKVTMYHYDAVGNRIRKVEDGGETLYTYNQLNQLLHAETPEAELSYTYDERGNQILEENETTGEIIETTYNVAGEMTQLVKKNGETTTFTQNNVYNQDGIRISRTQGSTESIISETCATAAVYSYSDFGETEEVVADSIGNEICYTGAIYDKDTDLYYMNARYYDAKNGRFISQDSYRGEIEDEGTWHLYAYCSNDPINYVDPTGHLKKRWYNKVSTVAKFFDAVVIVAGGISSAKAAKAYIKKHEKKITTFVRRKLIKEFKRNITTTYITTAISLVGHFLDISIGKILAKALDYADKWWGYKRNNGYILN